MERPIVGKPSSRHIVRARPRVRATLLGVSLLAVAVAAASGCAGSGMSYSEIKKPVDDSCKSCHSADGIKRIVAAVRGLAADKITATLFPDAHFPSALIVKTTKDLIDARTPPEDASIDPAAPKQQAWLLHELHELQALMSEATPPDYSDEKKFNAFSMLRAGDNYEGCEIAEKLDLGHQDDPNGMQPRWTKTLFDLIGETYVKLSDADRQKIRDYVDRLLPGGLRACKPSTGGSGS